MNDAQSQHDRLWQLIADAQGETDHEAANAIFRDAEQRARNLHEIEPDNAEHCYAIALTYYHRWDTPGECCKCIEWLRKAEELAPLHPWVPLFLGYQFLDDKRYAEAYAEFNRVNQRYFESIEQHWRNIKTDELTIVSLILSGSSLVNFSLLVRLADRYTNANVVDRPMPTEIVTALANPSNLERFTAPPKQVAAEACRLIRACDAVNVFPDELAALDTAAKAVG